MSMQDASNSTNNDNPSNSISSVTIPQTVPEIENTNKLIFQGISQEIYDYNPKDFVYVDIIESSRHIVKEFLFAPKNIKMAVKTIRIPQNKYQDQEKLEKLSKLKKEVSHFRALANHSNIVNFYGLCLNDGEAMICMELMDMSLYDLYLVVHEKQEKFPEKFLGYVAVQILEALGFCKLNNFIHRDVKPKNILLNSKGEVKLCDFGESRILKDSLASTFVGTIAYWPPERFETKKDEKTDEYNFHYDVRSDIWSLGISLAETAYGSLPFLGEDGKPISRENNRQENIVTIQHCIVNTDKNELTKRCFGNAYSKGFIDFVNMCLEKLEKRPKYDKLKETEFYKFYIQKDNVKQEEVAKFFQDNNKSDD